MKNERNEGLDLRAYYMGLTKKEKSKLLFYLTVRHGMNVATASRKLLGTIPMNQIQREVIEKTIKEGAWRG